MHNARDNKRRRSPFSSQSHQGLGAWSSKDPSPLRGGGGTGWALEARPSSPPSPAAIFIRGHSALSLRVLTC